MYIELSIGSIYFVNKMVSKALNGTKLFSPIKVGEKLLKQRITHMPTTRLRSNNQVPTDLQLKYYGDRAKAPGTLISTEATAISDKTANGFVPGIWSEQQTIAWKKIVDEVHKHDSFISCQLWAMGRSSDPNYLKSKGNKFNAPSAIYKDEASRRYAEKVGWPLQEMTKEEIKEMIYTDFTNAAKNALKAGFDYIELHHGNGYLLEQFLYPVTNQRTDEYGGSIENRSRLLLELLDHLLTFIPASKIGIKMAPFLDGEGLLGVKEVIHPIVTNGYILNELQQRANKGQELAFVGITDARMDLIEEQPELGNLDWVRSIWKGIIIRHGNYGFETGEYPTLVRDIEADDKTIAGFGRHFIANPDLVERLKNGYDLNAYDRNTFYSGGNWGYNTYPKYGETVSFSEETEKKVQGVPLA